VPALPDGKVSKGGNENRCCAGDDKKVLEEVSKVSEKYLFKLMLLRRRQNSTNKLSEKFLYKLLQ
jgi:hypothetical protein